MKNTVIIKGNRYGISIVLDKDEEFSKLMDELEIRLEKAEEFFDSKKQLAVTFEGRELSNDELDNALSIIKNNSKLNIQYVMEKNSELETTFFDIIQEAKEQESGENQMETDKDSKEEQEETVLDLQTKEEFPHTSSKEAANTGMFYRGTLRSGQTLETKDSLVIIGDVNPGATVIAGGNIVIIGALKGSVTAGSYGNKNAFVMALSMNPIQIQIADVIARSSDSKRDAKRKHEAMIATVNNDQIYIDAISKAAIQDIHF